MIEGSEAAFQTIYSRYATKLYSYARKNIPLKEDCEQIVQEVFVSIWARREKLTNVTAVESYLLE
ncbi:sigma factor [Ohtaekwangia koreensis]|uniref:sigma factor n=1 Tax=Ohtaekwangia koreensis TaxID=688867 RepID=UPI0009A8F1AC